MTPLKCPHSPHKAPGVVLGTLEMGIFGDKNCFGVIFCSFPVKFLRMGGVRYFAHHLTSRRGDDDELYYKCSNNWILKCRMISLKKFWGQTFHNQPLGLRVFFILVNKKSQCVLLPFNLFPLSFLLSCSHDAKLLQTCSQQAAKRPVLPVSLECRRVTLSPRGAFCATFCPSSSSSSKSPAPMICRSATLPHG